ncbi:FeoC like transcriptional regulator [Piscirickettsia salmonis]|uniref:FeoC-like transcriptional regulator n=1 Tax=Piscirickettsia salmonis TaxID=1238 RepID=UPI0012B87B18|nr:FeoC-like transcriptional regulator [Piscirickettsia salmonis]QGP49077.1 FeoC like transcriptional regulator [Piscirickettsia salmonis]QGP56167.1 FeoC like transcriptional regulator [Piscirickettsia salmonis]QGP57965.1 FeoC like transcriptional regulator [Piscirickettsia salmonis]QGP65736.1 FeoC like transcriptional regulator [Piscirickettsia salmonis]
MITLSKLKKYLRTHGYATLKEIVICFQTEPKQVQCMLQHFINKGQVQARNISTGCTAQCSQTCPITTSLLYEWKDQPAQSQPLPLNKYPA